MIGALVGLGWLVICALLLLGTLAYTRAKDQRERDRRLKTYLISSFPSDLALADLLNWLGVISGSPGRPALRTDGLATIVFETSARAGVVIHRLRVSPQYEKIVIPQLRSHLPGIRVGPDETRPRRRWTQAIAIGMRHRQLPLRVPDPEALSKSLLTSLQSGGADRSAELLFQWVLTPALPGMAPVRSAAAPVRSIKGGLWRLLIRPEADRREIEQRTAKLSEPNFAGVLRIAARARSRRQAKRLLFRVQAVLASTKTADNHLRRRWLPSSVVCHRLTDSRWPGIAPAQLALSEVASLLAWPIGSVHLAGVTKGQARQLPPPPTMASRGLVVAESNYPETPKRRLALATADRLHHVHIMGPTGAGKSALFCNMALQDIAAGNGICVIDPKGDLVTDIAARLPANRLEDLVVLDPSETNAAVVGFNPLAVPNGSDGSREVAADHLLGIFYSIYRDSWGPRTDDVLRMALLSLTHTAAPDGSAFTLMEVPELLTNAALRQYVKSHQGLPNHLRPYWQWYDESLSDSQRLQAIGPVLNKLRAFSMRGSGRLVLGQSQGLALDEEFFRRRILLVSLAKGKLGGPTADLIGSLLVAALWQAIQGRIRVPPTRRRPFFVYIDEFQNVVRFGAGDDLSEMAAQARGLGVGLNLAHQILAQLPTGIKEATLGTMRTHILFQVEYDDAKALEPRFAPLTRSDLSGLGRFEIALKACVGGQAVTPTTGTTRPLGEVLRNGQAEAVASQRRHGMPRAEIEAQILARRLVKRVPSEPLPGTGSHSRQ